MFLTASIVPCHSLRKKTIGGFFIFLLLAELIFAAVILPQNNNQKAQAMGVPDVIGGPANIMNFFEALFADAAKLASSAYDAAGTWVSAAVDLWDKQSKVVKAALEFAWNRLRRVMLNMLVNDIIKWIQGGGQPRFVSNWQNFLQTAADRAAGQFVTEYMGAGFLCGPFAAKLRIALAAPATFDESVKCTLSEISDNIDSFFTDFSRGGWKGWLAVTELQNNIFGADLLALDQRFDVIAKAKEAAQNEALAGSGYLDDKVCVKRKCGDSQPQSYTGSSVGWKKDELDASCSCLQWESISTGRVAGDALQQALGIDIPWIISAKEFSEYAGAIIDAVINRAIREGIATLSSSAEGTSAGRSGAGISTPATVSVDITAYSKATKISASLNTLIPQEKLYKENLNKILNEYQQSLDILNQAKTSQENSVRILQQTVSTGCAIPPGSSIGGEVSTIQSTCATVCPCETTTTRNQYFSISGLGSGTLQQITNQRFDLMSSSDNWGMAAQTTCSSLTYSATQSSIINSSLSSSNEIAALQLQMQAVQENIDQINAIIADSTEAEDTAQAYAEAYDTATMQDTGAADSATMAGLATDMDETAQIAIASLQDLTSNSSDDFSDQLNSIMALSQAVVQKNNDVIRSRGFNSDCAYVESGTYRAFLCAAQAKEAELQNNLNYCSTNSNSGN